MQDTLGTIRSKNKEERAAQFWRQWGKTQPCKTDSHLISFSEGIISETSRYVKALPPWLGTPAVPERLSCWRLLSDIFHSAVKSKYLGSVSAVVTAMSPVVLQKKQETTVVVVVVVHQLHRTKHCLLYPLTYMEITLLLSTE